MYYEVTIDLKFTDDTTQKITVGPISQTASSIMGSLKNNIKTFKNSITGNEIWYPYIIGESGESLKIGDAIASAEIASIQETKIL